MRMNRIAIIQAISAMFGAAMNHNTKLYAKPSEKIVPGQHYTYSIISRGNGKGTGKRNIQAQRRQIEERMEALCKSTLRADIPAPDAFGNPVGLACRMDRLQAIGDGQVPAVAAAAWETLSL